MENVYQSIYNLTSTGFCFKIKNGEQMVNAFCCFSVPVLPLLSAPSSSQINDIYSVTDILNFATNSKRLK